MCVKRILYFILCVRTLGPILNLNVLKISKHNYDDCNEISNSKNGNTCLSDVRNLMRSSFLGFLSKFISSLFLHIFHLPLSFAFCFSTASKKFSQFNCLENKMKRNEMKYTDRYVQMAAYWERWYYPRHDMCTSRMLLELHMRFPARLGIGIIVPSTIDNRLRLPALIYFIIRLLS